MSPTTLPTEDRTPTAESVLVVHAGGRLALGPCHRGCRGYVAIAGGVGTIWGVIAAVLIWGFSRSYLQLAGWDANGLVIVSGLLLLASVTIPRLVARTRQAIAHRSPRQSSRGGGSQQSPGADSPTRPALAGHE